MAGDMGNRAEQMAREAADKARHMADNASTKTGGTIPNAAMMRANWPTYLMYAGAGLGGIYLAQWMVTGKKPNWMTSFMGRQERKIDETLTDVRSKANEVRNEAVRAAHQVGSVVNSKADDVRDEAMRKADNVAGAVESKAHEARRKL